MNPVNYLKAYSSNGQFMPYYWFILLYDCIPSVYSYETADDVQHMDLSEVDVEKEILPLFTKVDGYRTIAWDEMEFEEDDEDSEKHGLDFQIAADEMVITVDKKEITIFHKPGKTGLLEISELIYSKIPNKKQIDKACRVNLIQVYQNDYYTTPTKIKETNIDVSENYNDDFEPIHKDIIEFLNDRRSGLILLYGAVGTGKTNYIRYLINSQPKDYIIVPSSIACRLGDPDLISFITSNKDSVFILEDCEQLLEDRMDNPFNNAISTILNMADGLLSDITNIKFICTFNAPINKIDEALLRKGRCAAKYEFGPLTEEKVKALNDKYDLNLPEIKEMTVAEIYNSEKRSYTEEKKVKKIGF